MGGVGRLEDSELDGSGLELMTPGPGGLVSGTAGTVLEAELDGLLGFVVVDGVMVVVLTELLGPGGMVPTGNGGRVGS